LEPPWTLGFPGAPFAAAARKASISDWAAGLEPVWVDVVVLSLPLWAAAPEVVAAPEPVAVPEALLTFCLGGGGDGGGAALLNCCLTGGVVLAGLYGAAEPASARIGPANVTMVSTALALIHFRCRAMGASQS